MISPSSAHAVTSRSAGTVSRRITSERYCVVADDVRVGPQLAEVLHEVVGERVVVVDDEDHARGPATAMRSARITPRALEHVSSHSVLGSESATIPAPTCTDARLP